MAPPPNSCGPMTMSLASIPLSGTRCDVGVDDSSVMDLLLMATSSSIRDDPELHAWTERWYRASIGPGGLIALIDAAVDADIRRVLPSVQAPTLVIQAADDAFVTRGNGEYLAAHIPNAELRIVPGSQSRRALEDDILDQVETFLTGAPPPLSRRPTVSSRPSYSATSWLPLGKRPRSEIRPGANGSIG